MEDRESATNCLQFDSTFGHRKNGKGGLGSTGIENPTHVRLSVFSASMVADFEDQEEAQMGQSLRQIPVLFTGERQLP